MPRVRCVKFAPALLLAACGGDDGPSMMRVDAATADTAMPDAAIGTTTTLTAMINSTRTLTNAGYGINANGTLYIEAHGGGAAGCPDMNSPTPDYTLILGSIPAMSAATATSTTGVLFDFVGDLHDSAPAPLAPTAITLTDLTYVPDGFVALDANLTYPGGTLTGHLYATHCTSYDG